LSRKRYQRVIEHDVPYHEFLTEEAKKAMEVAKKAGTWNEGDARFLYQGKQVEIYGKKLKRVAERLKKPLKKRLKKRL
jgi:hypothetical protein